MTGNLTAIIINQERDLQNYDKVNLKRLMNANKVEKEKILNEDFTVIKYLVSSDLKRSLELAVEKGSGSWLGALPLQSLGYVLNKQEFRDSICLRYGWKIANTPSVDVDQKMT